MRRGGRTGNTRTDGRKHLHKHMWMRTHSAQSRAQVYPPSSFFLLNKTHVFGRMFPPLMHAPLSSAPYSQVLSHALRVLWSLWRNPSGAAPVPLSLLRSQDALWTGLSECLHASQDPREEDACVSTSQDALEPFRVLCDAYIIQVWRVGRTLSGAADESAGANEG
jgi:hypothetical protein